MKKTGFTLAETLITLLIIGIVSAIMLPAITKIKPDEKKVAYLKAYDTLTKTINNIMNNSSYYSISANIGGHVVNASRFPLFNTAPGIKNPNKRYEGNKKLCNIFADSLGARNPDCRDEERGEGYTPNLSANSNDVSFRTQNGMRWWFVPIEHNADTENMVATLKTDVYVDVNPKGSNKCLYNDCADPDIYRFRIREDGRIYAMDAKGQGYIDTRRHWLKKDNIGVVANNDRGTRFTYEPDGDNNGGNGGGGGGGNEPPNNQPNNPVPNPNPEPENQSNCPEGFEEVYGECAIPCGGKYQEYDVNCILPTPVYLMSAYNFTNGTFTNIYPFKAHNNNESNEIDAQDFEDEVYAVTNTKITVPMKFYFYYGPTSTVYFQKGGNGLNLGNNVWAVDLHAGYSSKGYKVINSSEDLYGRAFRDKTSIIANNPQYVTTCSMNKGDNNCISSLSQGQRLIKLNNYISVFNTLLHSKYAKERLVAAHRGTGGSYTAILQSRNVIMKFKINNGNYYWDVTNLNANEPEYKYSIYYDNSNKIMYIIRPSSNNGLNDYIYKTDFDSAQVISD